jgi:hypothetical protein
MHTIDGAVVRQRKNDGFWSATDMCKIGKKRFSDFYRLDQTNEYLKLVARILDMSQDQLIEVRKGGNDKSSQGSLIHPRVATYLACWISPLFAVKIGGWIEEWKGQHIDNINIYNESICQLIPSAVDQKERAIQERLCSELGGQMEVGTDAGYIDILTDQMIIEVKEVSGWKGALGQVLSYALYYPDRRKTVALFDVDESKHELLSIIRKTYEKYDVGLIIC